LKEFKISQIFERLRKYNLMVWS